MPPLANNLGYQRPTTAAKIAAGRDWKGHKRVHTSAGGAEVEEEVEAAQGRKDHGGQRRQEQQAKREEQRQGVHHLLPEMHESERSSQVRASSVGMRSSSMSSSSGLVRMGMIASHRHSCRRWNRRCKLLASTGFSWVGRAH